MRVCGASSTVRRRAPRGPIERGRGPGETDPHRRAATGGVDYREAVDEVADTHRVSRPAEGSPSGISATGTWPPRVTSRALHAAVSTTDTEPPFFATYSVWRVSSVPGVGDTKEVA